jgi:hypothetical protein
MDPNVVIIQVPRLDCLDIEPIADGCSNNTNYYTSSASRATCCCSCDKPS